MTVADEKNIYDKADFRMQAAEGCIVVAEVVNQTKSEHGLADSTALIEARKAKLEKALVEQEEQEDSAARIRDLENADDGIESCVKSYNEFFAIVKEVDAELQSLQLAFLDKLRKQHGFHDWYFSEEDKIAVNKELSRLSYANLHAQDTQESCKAFYLACSKARRNLRKRTSLVKQKLISIKKISI